MAVAPHKDYGASALAEGALMLCRYLASHMKKMMTSKETTGEEGRQAHSERRVTQPGAALTLRSFHH